MVRFVNLKMRSQLIGIVLDVFFYDNLIKSHKFRVLADSKDWLIDEFIQYLKYLIYLRCYPV